MANAEKPIPSKTVANAAPPNEDWEFFENCEEHPFRHSSGGFEMVNAWWLAEASHLAYADTRFAVPRFRKAGLSEVRYFDGESTQCYVGHNDDFVVVAFSGTDMREREDPNDARDVLTDWLVNLDAGMVDSGRGGRVHRGFARALDEVWDPQGRPEDERLKPYLDGICEGGRRKIWFTGHSLGGALATLAAGRYEDGAPGLYTFGSPRVGDRAYAEDLRLDAYRFVNNDDIVPEVPFHSSYHHVGATKYIDGEGLIRDEPIGQEESKEGLRGGLARALAPLRKLRRGFDRGLLENSLTDHAPIYYAVHTWNNWVREGTADPSPKE